MPTTLIAQRREFLRDAFCGLGSLALATMAAPAEGRRPHPLAPRQPPQPASAKSVIFLFMAGGPSHVDTFDPKPLLNRLDGQPRPASFGEAKYQFVRPNARLLGSRRTFRPSGQSGLPISDLFPHTAQQADELAIIRSCYGDKVVHSAAQYELFSGRTVPGFPSLGAWAVYGLGAETDSLPAYVVMPDPDGALEAGQPMYAQGFLPAVNQPTMLRPGPRPVRNLEMPSGVDLDQQRKTVQFIQQLNRAQHNQAQLNRAQLHQAQDGGQPVTLDNELHARIAAYDLAFKMQMEAPEVFDLTRETRETLRLYGVGQEPTDDYGRRCLLARRLVERGVRFTVVVSGGGPGNKQWDAHANLEENHLRLARETDRPIAALLRDLKRRGLLESTLVLWGGEFGRSPEAQSGVGRDHHNLGFTMWMAGGGVRGGQAIGGTDEIGLRAVDNPLHFRDLHTTMLHLLGFEQNQLTFPHLGREERLTLVEGRVARELLL